jgi:nicotinamidase-related amidase
MEAILAHTARLLDAARRAGVPVFFTTTAFEPDLSDAQPWVRKIPALAELIVGTPIVEIDRRVAPRKGEAVIVKKRASAFAGTFLAQTLTGLGVDTVIITGVTAAGCIRHTAEDAIAHGFRPIVARETIGDRIPDAVEYNLFDIDAKFGDVEPVASVLRYLETLSGRRQP